MKNIENENCEFCGIENTNVLLTFVNNKKNKYAERNKGVSQKEEVRFC